jgi:hypothetical protein
VGTARIGFGHSSFSGPGRRCEAPRRFRGGVSMIEHPGKAPAVFCPACRKPMTPSEPTPVTSRMFEIIYQCDACDATTLRTVKVLAGNLGNRRGAGER